MRPQRSLTNGYFPVKRARTHRGRLCSPLEIRDFSVRRAIFGLPLYVCLCTLQKDLPPQERAASPGCIGIWRPCRVLDDVPRENEKHNGIGCRANHSRDEFDLALDGDSPWCVYSPETERERTLLVFISSIEQFVYSGYWLIGRTNVCASVERYGLL